MKLSQSVRLPRGRGRTAPQKRGTSSIERGSSASPLFCQHFFARRLAQNRKRACDPRDRSTTRTMRRPDHAHSIVVLTIPLLVPAKCLILSNTEPCQSQTNPHILCIRNMHLLFFLYRCTLSGFPHHALPSRLRARGHLCWYRQTISRSKTHVHAAGSLRWSMYTTAGLQQLAGRRSRRQVNARYLNFVDIFVREMLIVRTHEFR